MNDMIKSLKEEETCNFPMVNNEKEQLSHKKTKPIAQHDGNGF